MSVMQCNIIEYNNYVHCFLNIRIPVAAFDVKLYLLFYYFRLPNFGRVWNAGPRSHSK